MKRSGTTVIVRAVAVGLIALAAGGLAVWRGSLFPRHNPIQDLEELPVNSAAHLIGVVTYVDGPGRRFWIQDETGAVAVGVDPAQARVRVGETVAVDAVKTAPYDPGTGPASVGLRWLRVRASLARVRPPAPFAISLGNLPGAEKNGVRVQVTAVVRSFGVDGAGRAILSISNLGREAIAMVAEPAGASAGLVNAEVRIRGVPEEQRAANGTVLGRILWVVSGRDIEVVKPPLRTPRESIRGLFRAGGMAGGHLIRVRGRVAAVYPDGVLVADRWGAIACAFDGPVHLAPGSAVEVEGFPAVDGLRIDLTHARATLPGRAGKGDEAPSEPRVLTTVAALRNLPAAQAARALPVRIRGVVTWNDPIYNQMYLQDRTSGIYVKYSGHPKVPGGALVEVRGLSGAGDYAPVIVAPEFRVVGAGTLPAPVRATAEKAEAGALDSQYVTLEGVLHSIRFAENPNYPVVSGDLKTELGQVHVFTTPSFPDLSQVRRLDDAKVRIRGVFSSIYNAQRQLLGYQLLVESPGAVEVIEPAVPDPFAVEATPIGWLLRFSPHARYGHRVKVAGTATLVERDFLYLQDPSGGVELWGDTHGLQVGDGVEATGYPTLAGRYSPVMTEANFRRTRRAAEVGAAATDAESIVRGNHDSTLVTVEGRLLMVLTGPARENLVLQSGVRTFSAQLDTTDLGADLHELRPGEILRLTGICSTQVDSRRLYRLLDEDPTTFTILLRTPADVTVIGAPPFWTLEHTLALLAVCTLAILAILVWVALLRRRVREQTEALRRASETAQAIRDLSDAMQDVTSEENLNAEVSVRGSEEIARLVVGFNVMLAELRQRDRAKGEAEARLQQMALIDDLTGLPNRRLMADRLSRSLARAHRERRKVAVLYIDLDGFKLVNDSLGHNIGDLLLREVGRRLESRTRASDTLARIGGDEFALVLDEIREESDAETAARSLIALLSDPFEVEGRSIRIGASIGISIYPDHAHDGDFLLQQADCAMYAAKRNGKNRVVHFGDELGNAARARLTLEGELRRAIAEGEIAVHYQPEFDIATNELVRFEALARWTHPQLGTIPPLRFIPVAEEAGLIVSLGTSVMEQACREGATWQEHATRPIQVAVNVSSAQFGRDSFVEEVESVLRRTGLDPLLLQIELTESATVGGIERAAKTIRRLKSMGISVAIDDFGTGYSCLSYLPRLAFDALKIDRSFVNELMVRPETRAFVQSILTMAHNLGMRVIVEGIESQDQLDLIRALGADEAQGYLLGMPSPVPLEQLRQAQNAAA